MEPQVSQTEEREKAEGKIFHIYGKYYFDLFIFRISVGNLFPVSGFLQTVQKTQNAHLFDNPTEAEGIY